MSGVDNRIVTMKFDNKEFEQNAKTSISTLAKIKDSMNFGQIVGGTVRALGQIDGALSKIGLKTPFSGMIATANKGLNGVGTIVDRLGLKNPFARGVEGAGELEKAAQSAGGRSGMGALEGGVTAVSGKFIALTTVAVTALSNITNRAINAGTAFAKSFTVQPVLDGLHEYETNLQAIQTVQANTDQPLSKVNASLQELNTYSDQTIYNFGEMARNVGTFTAAGVDLKTSVSSIKGIANLAALSGSSSAQAATAMYQLSQAISSGRVGLQDWNSVVNAGMGGKKLQNALAQTAIAMGDIDSKAVKMVGPMKKLTINGKSFRESIQAKPGEKPWLSSEILVNTLATLDGRFSKTAQQAILTAKGTRKYTDAQIDARIHTARLALEQKNGVKYTDEQFKALQGMSTNAFKAATQVKTLGQVFDILKETIGSGWSASFQNIFGNLNQAKKLFTGMSNTLNDIVKKNALTRNNMLAAWAKGKNSGRNALIDGLKNAWTSFYAVLQAVERGFRSVFPAKTAKDLISFSRGFKELMARMTPSIQTIVQITRISRGLFSILDIGFQVVKAIAGAFKNLFLSVGGGSGNFLLLAAQAGSAIGRFDEMIKKSGVLVSFFNGLAAILAIPLNILVGLAQAIGGLFTGFNEGAANKVGTAVDGVGHRLSFLSAVGDKVRQFFANLGPIFENAGKFIGKSLGKLGPAIANVFTSDSFGRVLDTINTGLFAGLVLLVKNFFDKGIKVDGSTGLLGSIKETLGSVTGAFQNMQQNLKANILLKLASAIAIMAGALLILSTIDPKALTKAMIAMTTGFGVLIGAMAGLLKVMGPAGILQLYVITSGMTKMALAILLLATALKMMAGIEFADMLRGLFGFAASLFILSKAITPLAANSKGMAKASFSLILLGVAMNILAAALKLFATMSWKEMIKGLAGLTGTLIALAIGLKAMPELKAEALGLLALGVAINLIAAALKVMATMSWVEMAKGALVLAGSLGIIALAIKLMPKTMILQAAGLLVLSAALNVLAGALKIMATMGWADIGRGLTVLGGSLLILAAALKIIGPTAPLGAAGLLIAATALGILAPILVLFGAMKWSAIGKSLVVLTGIFVILGVAANTIGPGILVLGAGLLLLGAGLALMGSAALAAATAFGIVVGLGAAGIQILSGLLKALIDSIPPALAALAVGVLEFIATIGAAAPQIAESFSHIMSAILASIISGAPKIALAALAIINAFLKVIGTAVPRIANTGLRIIGSLLGAIAKNIGRIADKATDVIVAFLGALGRNLPRIVDAGFKMIIAFLHGIAKAIRENSAEMGRAGVDIGSAIIEGVVKGMGAAGGAIKDKLMDLVKDAWKGAKNFLGIGGPSKLFIHDVGARIPQGMAIGVNEGSKDVVDEVGALGKRAASKMAEVMKGVDEAFTLTTDLSQPTIAPVLDLSNITRDAAKMNTILANTPVVPTVSYQTASDISAMTTTPNGGGTDGGTSGNGGGDGGTNIDLTLELHSPKPIDSVEAYRAGKTLISQAKEALSK